MYAAVCYTQEKQNKRAFVGSLSEDMLFKRWLRIFETFPEGLAFMRNGQILYANEAVADLFRFGDDCKQDADKLKRLLKATEVEQAEHDGFATTVWSFIRSSSARSGPFKVRTNSAKDDEELSL